ncbi:RNA-dependent RNA polymerase [Maple mottle-associated virus]|uniref:RNA-directed RNA polymerase L n=1 Tax=Maple mottle-associated virus TaxID=2778521 RepID=A0A7L8Y9A5_9VIRU|nr:RNA-dependent RNA polymerase [Maple mottle-associated virus]QOI17315.1 RNA-dependent RNA polymerase [Maple mottle-associated virus]
MESKRGEIYNDAVAKIRSGESMPKELLQKFLKIANVSLKNYTIVSKKRNIENVYKQCTTDSDFHRDIVHLAEQLLYISPDPSQIDIVVTVIGLLELSRHDTLMFHVNDHLQQAGYKVRGYDKPINEVFPEINSILTPDIFFSSDDEVDYILELKVRNERTDLSYYYRRYADAIGDKHIQVCVFNVSPVGFIEMGDYKLSNLIDIDHNRISDVTYCIELCGQLRAKYNKYPEFPFYHNDKFISDNAESFIDSGFKETVINHKDYDEISSLFGSSWNKILSDIDDISLLTNPIQTSDVLLDANKILYQDCQDRYKEFIHHLNVNYLETDSYSPTNLKDINLVKKLDNKNKDLYNITKKYKPSIYMPIAKTVFLSKYEHKRSLFYRSAFVDMKDSHNPYTKSVINLLDSIFNTVAIELIIKKNDDIDIKTYNNVLTPEFCRHINDKTQKFKKIATVSGITSDTTILNNNAFSINHHVDKHMKDNIIGFKNKHYDSEVLKKDCISIQDSEEDLIELMSCMADIYGSPYHHGTYSNDLVNVDSNNMNTFICDLPPACTTKYLEHLYSQHVIFKALISLNTVNSHRYRLVQTSDPCVILIMLPNADTLKSAPLRYFTATIIEKKDTTSFRANELLGLAHELIKGRNYNIILSKVISLDVTRLKLLNHSFSKYCLIMTYYSNLKNKIKHDTHFMTWIMCQFITVASLSVTDTYKNFIMAVYSDYSNIDNLIDDKLESRPTNLGHAYIIKKCLDGIVKAVQQLKVINKNKREEEIDTTGDLINTGFSNNLTLKLPISNISVNNPKEIIHEAFMLFYLGNKGLHGSPQELLKLYHVPYKFEKEYNETIEKYNTILQENYNNSNMSFSYDVLRKTSLVAYANLFSKKDIVRQGICTELSLDKPMLSLKQFSSTKSMVSNTKVDLVEPPTRLRDNLDIQMLEKILNESIINDEHEFMQKINSEIYRINTKRLREETDTNSKSDITLLPEIYIETVKDVRFIRIKRNKFSRMLDGSYIKQNNVKVFDEFYKLTEDYSLLTLKDAYKRLIHDDDLLIRIFYKDQRTADDREIYTGNAQTRLCLYPIEKTYKAICKHIPGEAITISGDQKQKKLLDQRLILIKEKRQMIRDKKTAEIYSVSSDASKWSARDLFLKFIVTITTNPYLHPDEKWFLIYLCFRYYKKNIVMTDNIFNDMLKLVDTHSKNNNYEEMTDTFKKNHFVVRSNWLQGNLNMISSFVHHCSTIYTDTMLKIFSDKNRLECHMTSMVHSDDSTYDFLICTGTKSHQKTIKKGYVNKNNIGKLIIALITFSNRFHCITLNEKKTYISTFYKEFLSTIIVGNELFFFYLADLLPLASDTSYTSPMQDLASYSGYINNAFSHACPRNMIKTAITLINHLTLSTYNMHNTADKNPRSYIDSTDLPIQIYPRYKLPIELAGMIPYYSADAYNIMHDVIDKLGKFKTLENELLEDILTTELLQEYLTIIKDNAPKILTYLKSCILCMDYTQYERDDADPYNIIDYDLSQKSIINVISLNKGARLKKTYTYKKYLESESNVRLQSAIHPEWCVKKPIDPELIKMNILQNYTNPNFRDGLIFSTPAIDYGRRIIGSNSNMYTISSHVMEKDKARSIKSVYKELNDKIDSIDVTAKDLQRYLSLYLLSDKKVSMALQVYYSKIEVTTMSKPTYNKVIQPRSIYAEDFGRYSNTSLIESLLVSRFNTINTVDPKVEKFINICDYVLERIGDTKIYEVPEDIDENYVSYFKFKYPAAINVDIDVEPIDDLGDIGYIAYKNKLKFLSLLVRYYNDIKLITENPSFNIPNYPSPSSLIMTIDSLLKKDEISSKVYLSNIKSTKYDDYLLTRYGMYAHNNFHIKYKLGYKIKIASSGKISNTLKTYKDTYDPLSFLTKLISRNTELFNELIEHDDFVIGHYKFNELMRAIHESNDISSSALLLMLGKIEFPRFTRSLVSDTRVYNHWLIPTNSDPLDKNASLVYYMCQGNIMKVRTMTQTNSYNKEGAVVFSMMYYKFINGDYGALETIKKKIGSDYAELLRTAQVSNRVEPSSRYSVFNINNYGRYTNRRDPDTLNVCQIYYARIKNIKAQYTEVDNNVKLILGIETNLEDFDFSIRLRNSIDDEYYIECLLSNLHIKKDAILGYLCDTILFHRYPEMLKPLMFELGPNQLIGLMKNYTEVDLITEKIDIDKYGFLIQISNYFRNKGNNYIADICQVVDIIALKSSIDITEERNPEKFINSCNKIKLGKVCNELVVANYKPNEDPPYHKLFITIMKYRFNISPIEKIILYIILIFKIYIHSYLDLDDELDF